MRYWPTKLFLFFYCLYNHCFCDCFYIFDVGQGNCQLAVYEEEKIGVLYDCGTSSTQEHVKITALKQKNLTYIFQNKEASNIDSISEIDGQEIMSDLTIQGGGSTIVIGDSKDRKSEKKEQKITKILSDKKDLPVINEIINSYQLDILLVILSHPDKGHNSAKLINHNENNDQ